MVCDYLFCGTCFLNFRLSDIMLFIEHKKRDCVATTTNPSCDRSSPDELMANLLECVQCFRKFPTAWPLLMHVQIEHQLLFANTFRQASFTSHDGTTPITPSITSEERTSDAGLGTSNCSLALPEPEVTSPTTMNVVGTEITPVITTSVAPDLVTIGTQTNVSWFRTQSRLLRKRSACCTSSLETDIACLDSNCPAAGRLCQCSNSRSSNSVCPCQCYCSQSGLKTIVCPPCGANVELQNNDYSNSTVACCTDSSAVDNLSQSSLTAPSCCVPRNSDCCSGNLRFTSSQSMSISCCPCPPAKRAAVCSTEAQTDFDPEFSSPDYADIAMLLATPDRDAVYQNEVEPLTTMVDPNDWTHTPTETPVNLCDVPSSEPVQPAPISQEVGYPNTVHSSQPSIQSSTTSTDSVTTCMIPEKRVDWVTSTQQVPSNEAMPLEQPYTLNSITTLQDTAVTRSVTHQFVCTECGNQYRQKVHLRKHIMTQHTRQKPYHCPSCNYTTVEKSHLTVHVRTHTGERPFVCRECDYASAQNCTLKAHYIRKHLNSRIFCSKCKEPFYTELERTNHERLCLGSRPYAAPSLSIPLSTNPPKGYNIKASGSPTRGLNSLL